MCVWCEWLGIDVCMYVVSLVGVCDGALDMKCMQCSMRVYVLRGSWSEVTGRRPQV